MKRLNTWWLVAAMVLAACGPAGTLTGKVSVEGGSAAGIAVIVYGPQSAATVTGDDGSFSVGSLPDGKYVVKATLRGADVEEQSVATTLQQGKASPEPVLSFKLSTAKVSGRVVFADGSSAQDLSVIATGPETRGVRTASDGAFTFENLKSGAYVVSVEAPDTKEGRVAIGVNATGTVMAGELRLTPTGRVAGSVSFNGSAVANVEVTVTGTGVRAVTDATGRFSLEGVPTGPQAILARVGETPFFRSATSMVTIARGANPDLMLALSDDPPPTGTVKGVVTFRGPRSPRDITVSAPGSGVSANPGVNGGFSLTLPVGVWDIVATAPLHQTLTLGRVQVSAGQVQTLPGQELSWYRPIWTSSTPIIPITPIVVLPGLTDTNPWTVITFTDGSVPRLALFNAQTWDFRLVATGSWASIRLSKTGKYLGWAIAQTVFVYDTANGSITAFIHPTASPTQFEFSADESTLFIVRAGPFLERIAIANPGTVSRFPDMGNATSIANQTSDRWFVRRSTDVDLVLPTSVVTQVFTQVNTFNATPAVWALTNCAATCQLRVLGPNSTSAVQDTSVNPPAGTITLFSGSLQSRADHPCFTQSGTSAFCVRASDGNHTPLVAVPSTFFLNEAGDRVIFTYTVGSSRVVREEAFPPQPGTMNLGSNTVGWNTTWISPTRAVAVEASGSPRTMHLIANGTVTTDTDIGAQPVLLVSPLVLFPPASTTQWKFVLGDGPVRTLADSTTAITPTGYVVRPLGTGPVTKYAAIAFEPTTLTIIDETAAMQRRSTNGSVSGAGGALRSGSNELCQVSRPGANLAFLQLNGNVLLELYEGDIMPLGPFGTFNLGGYFGRSSDQLTLFAASFSN